jgi:UDP-N-acetylglucosamine pyrophosphorylase
MLQNGLAGMDTSSDHFAEFERKMRGAGLSEAAIRAFRHNYDGLVAGQTGMYPESSIQPVADLPRFETVTHGRAPDAGLLSQTVILKLNGGLGTSMGLEKAKSLLEVKDGLTFLDFIARQILFLRSEHKVALRFMLMDSYNTSRDTLDCLRAYPDLGDPAALELMQSRAPKVDAKTLRPISWSSNPQLEWCPPGHGDVYPSLLGSGTLDRLLGAGVKFLFVSNADNLGASLDVGLLSYFAASGNEFLMEVAERTASDRKGGHLAQQDGRLLLRESGQCPEPDQPAFQDIQRHRFFNTNNLWLRLDSLRELLRQHGGFIPLPMIKNAKTVDPRDKSSPPVFQVETAMGAAIGCFRNAGAIVVPRTRFAPVKTTGDLLALRSDAYAVTRDWRLVLANQSQAQPPTLDLDPDHYRLTDQLEAMTAHGVPSLKECRELVVRGPVLLSNGNVFRGKVKVTNSSGQPRSLPAGTYADCVTELA